jgi:hypothetical protein
MNHCPYVVQCAGSIDPKTLVASGVVTDPQMRAIAAVIDRVKQAGG